ncbi:hypothetical protein MTO96_018979 [Rhipicephalus appendiculatus]
MVVVVRTLKKSSRRRCFACRPRAVGSVVMMAAAVARREIREPRREGRGSGPPRRRAKEAGALSPWQRSSRLPALRVFALFEEEDPGTGPADCSSFYFAAVVRVSARRGAFDAQRSVRVRTRPGLRRVRTQAWTASVTSLNASPAPGP